MRIIFLLIAIIFSAPDSGAQTSCPFGPGEATDDGVEDARLYPLDIGNEWHYSRRSGPFFESYEYRKVIKDTLIHNMNFSVIERRYIGSDIFGNPVGEYISDFIYESIHNEFVYFWSSSTGSIRTDINLRADIKSCYGLGAGDVMSVDGDFAKQLNIENDEMTFDVAKSYFFNGYQIGLFVSDVGNIKRGFEGVSIDLVYFKNFDNSIGNPITEFVSTYIENIPPKNTEINLELYPEILARSNIVKIKCHDCTMHKIYIYNLMGQINDEINSNSNYVEYNAGSSGLYFAVIHTDRYGKIVKKFVVL